MEPSLLFLNYIIQNTKYESLSQEKNHHDYVVCRKKTIQKKIS